MSEASAGGGRAVVERRLLQRSLEDESFRQRLLEDPRAAVEEELGTRLPEEIQVRAVEESAETIYLVLPRPPSRLASKRPARTPTGNWRLWQAAVLLTGGDRIR